MPEGPSMVILKQAVEGFKGKKIIEAGGTTTQVDPLLFVNHTVTDFKTWGKHFLICFKKFTIRIHFLLYGKYFINEPSKSPAKLFLRFKNGEIHFSVGSIQLIEEPLDEIYDWSADVMSDDWDPAAAAQKLKDKPKLLICDALMTQDIFSGVGNIIKNEVLYRCKVHPESLTGAVPKARLSKLIKETRIYSFQFLEWKKANVFAKHWIVYKQDMCPKGHGPLQVKVHGRFKRRTYYCERCQQLFK